MMNELLKQTAWQFKIFHKNNLIYISIGMTVIYTAIFFLIKDLPNLDKFLTLLIYNDPAIIGLLFIGLAIIIEKNQGVITALFTTPLQLHTFLISKIIALSIIGWFCALGMALAAVGFSIQLVHFSLGVLMTCAIFSLVGLIVVSYTTQFLQFMIRSIPIFIIFSLPLLNYFNLTDLPIFNIIPIQGGLNLIDHSYAAQLSFWQVISSYLMSIIWIVILYVLTYRIFQKRLHQIIT